MTKQTIQLLVKALAIGILLNVGIGLVPPTVDGTTINHGMSNNQSKFQYNAPATIEQELFARSPQ